MTSNVAQDFKEQVLNTQFSQILLSTTGGGSTSSSTFTVNKSKESITPIEEVAEMEPRSSSSYTLASDQSLYGRQLEKWLQPSTSPTESAAVQMSRIPLVQRSTLMSTPSLDASGMWYMLAMILPLFSVNNTMLWRCTPGNFMNAADLFVNHLRYVCGQARIQVQRLAEDQLARDFFATLMDIVLVIYAIGFLILSLYQASVFG